MTKPYLEEQISALAAMCEALICHIHYTDDESGERRPGHNGYPGTGCTAAVCIRYAEALSTFHFGELRENARKNARILALEERLRASGIEVET